MAFAETPAESPVDVSAITSPADFRLGESWRPLQRIKNDLLFYVASALLFLVQLLPARSLRALSTSLGALAFRVCTRERERSLRNLALCFPHLSDDERRSIAKRSFRALGSHLGDCLAALEEGFEALHVSEDARAILDAAVKEGKGVVFLSGHIGPWERIPPTMRGLGRPMTIVARASYDPRFTRLYDRLRVGTHVLYRDTPGFAMQFARALRNKAIVGLPIDLVSRGVRTDKGTLFGQPVETASGIFELAQKRGIPMIAGFAVPGDQGEELWICRLPEPTLEAWHRALEIAIQKNHLAWCWMHDRFR